MKYFATSVPEEWGGGKTDPYIFSINDQKDDKNQTNVSDDSESAYGIFLYMAKFNPYIFVFSF